MNDKLKYTILSKLINGEAPKEIAEEVEDASYATVLRLRRELEEAKANDTVDKLLNLDKAAFDLVLEGVKSNTIEGINESLSDIRTSVTAAEALQRDLQTTASILNTRVKSLSLSTDSVGELSMLADTLCALQNAFFNKNSTQVNVQNNYESAPSYGAFLSDKPASAN